MSRVVTVHICQRCGAQQWFAGSCPESGCAGRVKSFSAVLVEDIVEFKQKTVEQSSPVPASFVERFVDSLLEWSRSSSGA